MAVVLFSAVAVCLWWALRPVAKPVDRKNGLALGVRPRLITDRPEADSPSDFTSDISEKGVLAAETSTSIDNANQPSETNRGAALVAAGRRALESGDLITAFQRPATGGTNEPHL